MAKKMPTIDAKEAAFEAIDYVVRSWHQQSHSFNRQKGYERVAHKQPSKNEQANKI